MNGEKRGVQTVVLGKETQSIISFDSLKKLNIHILFFFRNVFIMFTYMSYYLLHINESYLQVQVLSMKCHIFAMKSG